MKYVLAEIILTRFHFIICEIKMLKAVFFSIVVIIVCLLCGKLKNNSLNECYIIYNSSFYSLKGS